MEGSLKGRLGKTRWEQIMYMPAKSLQSCLTLCDPIDCSPAGSSVHGILQARTLGWVAMPFSWGSSPPSDQTLVPCITGGFSTAEPLGKPRRLWGGQFFFFYCKESRTVLKISGFHDQINTFPSLSKSCSASLVCLKSHPLHIIAHPLLSLTFHL